MFKRKQQQSVTAMDITKLFHVLQSDYLSEVVKGTDKPLITSWPLQVTNAKIERSVEQRYGFEL